MSFDGTRLYKKDFTGEDGLRERVMAMMEELSPTIRAFAVENNRNYDPTGGMYPTIYWKEISSEGSVVRSIVAHPARDANGQLGIVLTGQAMRSPAPPSQPSQQYMVVFAHNLPPYKTLPDANSVSTVLRGCYKELADLRSENIVTVLEAATL